MFQVYNGPMHNSERTSMSDIIKVLPQYVIPQHFLTSLVYQISRCRWPLLKNSLIKTFIKLFKVDMHSALEPAPTSYSSFNDFFTRRLVATARPIASAQHSVISPVDGTVSQVGDIRQHNIIQAKGKSYTLKHLLVADELTTQFSDGKFITLYLAPKDYHRVHLALAGTLTRMIYVPGRLFAVNAHTVKVVDAVFARNERVINVFATDAGPMAIIMVGALLVGSMETVWAGPITPAKDKVILDKHYSAPTLQQGEEMGRFNMGSTVILLFPQNSIRWSPDLIIGKTILMGQKIAEIIR